MLLHFNIQFKILNRRFSDFGLPPIIAYLLLSILFVTVSNALFTKTEYAVYLYYFLVFSTLSKLSDRERNDFLKLCYKGNVYFKLRLLENLVIALPFIGFLIYRLAFIPILIIVAIVLIMTIINFNTNVNYTIPTPFYKTPFEFITGFRKTFFLFPIAYALAFISIAVDNFNLGIASIIFVLLICISYYSKPEKDFYVWSFNLSAVAFLNTKIKTAIYHSSLLVLLPIIILCCNFYHHFFVILFFVILGYIFIITMLLAKYSIYPKSMHIPEGIMIVFCVFFPPLLIVILPYFYKRAIKQLQLILE